MGENIDPAFRVVARGTTCFLMWRIENFQPVAVPRDQYGSFYDGDSYLILSVKETRGKRLESHIHFWLGENTSQDEAGTAAIKAVELDDYLGGEPIQHRETQGNESKIFLSYFKAKGGIKYMKGGASSGFNHVEHTVKQRLMHVKGKITPRMKEVDITWASMNEGDCYILDLGEALFVWNGTQCSRTERIKAMEYARKIRDDRGQGAVVVVEQGEESPEQMGDTEFKLFDEFLPVKDKDVLKGASAGGADDAYERKAASNLKLWKVAEEGNSLKVTEIADKPLNKTMLDPGDCFIVDNGEAGLWVWCGSQASKTEKKEAMKNALAFIKQRSYPNSINVTKVHQKGEPSEFKALFKVWDKEKLPGQPAPQNRIARTVQTKFDAATLHANPEIARDSGMPDDGSGTKKIYRIERQGNTYDMAELEKKHYGTLYGGDSYVILYTYLVNGREKYIIYFWLGRKSTLDEKGVAAKKTVELDDSLGGAAEQVRVVQGKEPNHFMAIFGGKLIIFDGGKAGWGQSGDEGPGDTYLLHVRGTSQYNTKAEQVPLTAESLNSNDVFVLYSKTSTYVWAGKGCTGDEREMAKLIAAISPKGYTLTIEGQEKDDFWNLLGGKKEYSSSPRLANAHDLEKRPPRLFQCSNASGRFTVNEIVDFVQLDLVPEDVFILDVFDTVYVWIGNEARPEEKAMAQDTAIEYLETDPSGRDSDTPIYIVKQNAEPPNFTGWFGVWDKDLWLNGKSLEQVKDEVTNKNISLERVTAKSSQGGDVSFSDVAKYSLDQLVNSPPDGVDPAHKEKYLSDEEFNSVFSMNYAKFVTLPVWKQQQLKKEVKLF